MEDARHGLDTVHHPRPRTAHQPVRVERPHRRTAHKGLYDFQRPQANPYEVLHLSVTDAVERTNFLRDSAKVKVGKVMPWLEAMSIRGMTYGPRELRAQIQGTYDAGAKSWALWNPGSKFSEYVPALRPADGGLSPVERAGWKAPQWELPRARLSKVVVARDRRSRTAADSSAATRLPATR